MSCEYYVYILECADGTYYTGITNSLERRIKQHNQGKASKFTRARRPVQYVYVEKVKDKSTALKQEYQFKQLSRAEKMRLIQKRGVDEIDVGAKKLSRRKGDSLCSRYSDRKFGRLK